MGGTTVEAPTPSAEEQDIYKLIMSQINQYNDYNQMMMPVQMGESGYEWTYNEGYDPNTKVLNSDIQDKIDALEKSKQDLQHKRDIEKSPMNQQILDLEIAKQQQAIDAYANDESNYTTLGDKTGNADYGKWTKMSDEKRYENMTAEQKAAYDLSMAQSERSLKAIKGELDPSVATLEQRDKEFQQLKETYDIEGDSWDTATAKDTIGAQNLNKFKDRWTSYLDAVRFGQAGSDMQSAVLGQGLTTAQTQNRIGTTQQLGSGYGASIPMYNSLLQPYQAYNMAGYQADYANAQNRAGMIGSGLGMLGMLGGMALGKFSSRDYKKDIKGQTKADEDKALKALVKARSYKYKYKPEMKLGNEVHLGKMYEESPKEIKMEHGGKKMLNLTNQIELQSMAIKALARKIERRKSA